jgi:outer membrane autotransporter protein
LEVEALAKSFTTVAANSLQRTIAQHLDNIIPKATGDLSLVLGDFQALSESDFNEAFASLSPDSYDISTRITSDIARLYVESLHQRMHSLRANLTSPSTGTQAKSNKDPILLAYNGPESSIGQILSETQRVEEKNRAGMWTTIFGQWGDQDEEDGYTGFDYSVGGLTFGLDYLLTDSLITGLSLGYADTKIDLDRDAGDGNIESLGGSIYGTYFNKHTYFETVLSYGDQSYDNNRNIVIGPLLRTAHSEHDGDVFSAYGAGGYSFQSKEWIIRPFGSMQYVYLDEDGFQESGAGSINLRVDGRKTESLVSNLGVRFARVFEFEGGRLVPEASLAWQYDFDIDDRNITTSFVGSPGNAFTIEGQDLENHSAKIGIGLTFINKRNFSVSLNYNAELRENYNSNGIIGYLRLTF